MRKLLSGNLYAIEGLPPPDQSFAFWLDAGLLFTCLANNLKTPADAEGYWQRIMRRFARDHNVGDENLGAMLEMAKVCHEHWNTDDGRLLGVLVPAAAACFHLEPGSEEHTKAGAGMIDEAAEFYGNAQRIILQKT